jgi:hypothetical protein
VTCDDWWDDLTTTKWGKVCKLIINCEHKLCVCVCVCVCLYKCFLFIFNKLDKRRNFEIPKAPKSFFSFSGKGVMKSNQPLGVCFCASFKYICCWVLVDC